MAQRLGMHQSSNKLLASLVLVKVKEIPPETFGGISFYPLEQLDQIKIVGDEF